MENKFSKSKLCVKECLLKCEKESPVNAEFVLPDYCPPIKRILTYRAEPSISSKNTSGNTLILDGIVSFRMIYLDDKDCLCNFESSMIFSENFECEFEFSQTQIKGNVRADKVNCRVLSERKIEIKGSVCINLCVNKVKEQEFICGDLGRSIEKLTTKTNGNNCMFFGEKTLIIEDEIALSDSQAAIGKILNYSANICPDDCRVMNNKVILKGNLNLKITYLSADSYSPCHFEQKIPYSQVCDMDGVSEECNCVSSESLIYLEVKCRNDGYDESRVMTVTAKMCIDVEASCCTEAETIKDIYATKGNAEATCQSIKTQRLIDRVRDQFTARKMLEFSKGAVGSIIDIWCDVNTRGIKKAEDCILIFGVAYVRMIICDANGNPEFCERAIDFEYKYPMSVAIEKTVCDADLRVNNISYIISSDSCVEVICELSVYMDVYESIEQSIVTEISLSDECESEDNACSIIICYIDEPTDIWSIAKQYKSSVDNIRKVNGIDINANTVTGSVIIP